MHFRQVQSRPLSIAKHQLFIASRQYQSAQPAPRESIQKRAKSVRPVTELLVELKNPESVKLPAQPQPALSDFRQRTQFMFNHDTESKAAIPDQMLSKIFDRDELASRRLYRYHQIRIENKVSEQKFLEGIRRDMEA